MPERASLPLRTCRMGRIDYVEAARLQRSLRAAREAGAVDDMLLLLEHDPVITCGSRTDATEIAYARTRDLPIVAVERGGKATWHGPGQVVAYPILHVDAVGGDVRRLVRLLEQAIIDSLLEHGVATGRREGYPGVWVEPHGPHPRKVASLGLRLTRGITFHGIAVNVSCDLDAFGWFTPCGIPDAQMTSVELELARSGRAPAPVADVLDSLERAIARHLHMTVQPVERETLVALATAYPAPEPDVALPGAGRTTPAIAGGVAS